MKHYGNRRMLNLMQLGKKMMTYERWMKSSAKPWKELLICPTFQMRKKMHRMRKSDNVASILRIKLKLKN